MGGGTSFDHSCYHVIMGLLMSAPGTRAPSEGLSITRRPQLSLTEGVGDTQVTALDFITWPPGNPHSQKCCLMVCGQGRCQNFHQLPDQEGDLSVL